MDEKAAMETPETIREFWFGANRDDAAVAAEKSSLWWGKHPDLDAAIRQRFAADVERAAMRELDTWASNPADCLALILLTDQFPRNIYRDTPQAFAFDAQARRWSRDGIQAGFDQGLRPIERVFFYLPLEHSESREDQDLCVALFEKLLTAVPPEHQQAFSGSLDFARRHQRIIARFGRFPHRNHILARASTPEELAFLAEPDSSF